MSAFADLYTLDEDKRIDLIGRTLMESDFTADRARIIGLVVEDHVKADRYVEKLTKKFPGIRVLDRFDGPVKGTVTVRLGAPLH